MGPPRMLLRQCFYLVCLVMMVIFLISIFLRDSPDILDEEQLAVLTSDVDVDFSKIPFEERVRTSENSTEPIWEVENYAVPNDPEQRPWYMQDGKRKPFPALRSRHTGRRLARIWPEEDPNDDRITNQMMYVPPDYDRAEAEKNLKKIMAQGMGEATLGRELFIRYGCPVDTCTIVSQSTNEKDAPDLILLNGHYRNYPHRTPNQIYMLYLLESPHHTGDFSSAAVNWTATYRRDSDIVGPYGRWQYFDPRITEKPQSINYAAGKTKQVAMFVSNCNAPNGRLNYVRELQKHISVDVYGGCGSLRCPRSQADSCFKLLHNDYKFYLAFENSNCKDYITEKFFSNGLGHDVLPIVMGARQSEYAKIAPHHSFIHVDEFESPKHLADYLHILDKNDDLYNSYFKWKGTGEIINTFFFCRVCAMLHDDRKQKTYANMNDWWRGEGICTTTSWREYDAKRNSGRRKK